MIRISLLTAALAVAPFVTLPAQADTVVKPSAPLQTTSSTRSPDASGLNLLSAPRQGAPVVRVSRMGSGSWVCSPAGFGQRSRCYSN